MAGDDVAYRVHRAASRVDVGREREVLKEVG